MRELVDLEPHILALCLEPLDLHLQHVGPLLLHLIPNGHIGQYLIYLLDLFYLVLIMPLEVQDFLLLGSSYIGRIPPIAYKALGHALLQVIQQFVLILDFLLAPSNLLLQCLGILMSHTMGLLFFVKHFGEGLLR